MSVKTSCCLTVMCVVGVIMLYDRISLRLHQEHGTLPWDTTCTAGAIIFAMAFTLGIIFTFTEKIQ